MMMKRHAASKVLSKAWAGSSWKRLDYSIKRGRGLRFLLLLCAGVLQGAPAGAQDVILNDDVQKMRYEVYAGGLNAVTAEMMLDYSQSGVYHMVFGAETRGVLGTLAPWVGSFETMGWEMPDNLLQPKVHESIAMWRNEREVKTYRYGRDGSFQGLVEVFKNKKPRTDTSPAELKDNTTDALSATLMVMENISRGGNCEGYSEVFDGNRRYALVFKHQRIVQLEQTRYNVFSGPAVECTVEVKPIAGRWYEKPRGWLSIQEQGRKLGTMPTVWFAQLKETATVVPVRVRVKTEYGTLFMHMTNYESGDIKLSLPE